MTSTLLLWSEKKENGEKMERGHILKIKYWVE